MFAAGNKGRGAMKKAVLGSTAEYVVNRATCACVMARAEMAVGGHVSHEECNDAAHCAGATHSP